MEYAAFLYNPAIDHGAPTHWGVLAGHFRQPRTYEVHRPRGTHDWLLTFTMDGQGAFSLDGETHAIGPHDITLLAPGCPHHYGTFGEVWDFFWVHFVPQQPWMDWLETIDHTNRFTTRSLANVVLIDRVHSIFQRLVADSAGLGFHDHALASNAVEELLIVLAGSVQRSRRTLDDRVDHVLTLLGKEYASPIEIAGLAHQVGLSPSRLSHLFKAQTGSSIMETLLQIRLRHAARLLARTALNVTEIAEAVGFASPYYFSKQFRQAYGMAPTRFREQATDAMAEPGARGNT